MGGTTSKFGPFEDSVSFKPDQINKSVVKKIKGLHIDEDLFPQAGVFVVGTECIFLCR